MKKTNGTAYKRIGLLLGQGAVLAVQCLIWHSLLTAWETGHIANPLIHGAVELARPLLVPIAAFGVFCLLAIRPALQDSVSDRFDQMFYTACFAMIIPGAFVFRQEFQAM